jgi:TolB protein
MPESESFDAFYARTVWNVTSQMHSLSGDDGLADHAIREAYAKAYQQWYQVSGYRDSEAWVLATAKDAYERRRAESPGLGQSSAAETSDSGTWPGFFRPDAQPVRNRDPQGQPIADPDGTIAPLWRGGAGREGTSGAPGGAGAPDYFPAAGAVAAGAMAGSQTTGADAGTRDLADGLPGWYRPTNGTAPPTRAIGYGPSGPDGLSPDGLGRDGIAGMGRGPGRPGRAGPGSGGPSHLATPRNLIVAGVAVAALVIVGIAYVSGRGHHAPAPAASQGTSAKPGSKPKPHMLAAGRTGQRSTIPWSLVGPGWALAEFSTAQPQADGSASGPGRYTTYLVDPLGGKYVIASSSGSAAPQLIAWSGDGKNALFGPPANETAGSSGGYQLLRVPTGNFSNLSLPSGVSAVGFSRPDGLNILAVQNKAGGFWLQRYDLVGAVQGKVGALPSKHGESWPANGCGYGCALSSPDGLVDVVGIFGDHMKLFGNGGGRGRKLRVPDSNSCVPLSWWNGSTILADCLVAHQPGDATRLWLVPENGSAPTPLTPPTAAGNGRIAGAWQAGSAVYVTSVTSSQCPGAAASTGLGISPASQSGTASPISIPNTTNNVNNVAATSGSRLLVLAQTSCPGTSSLVWFNPSAGKTTMVLPASSSQAGVIAAVPYGNGPTALSTGQ